VGLREELSESFTHAEKLHLFAEDVLKEANVMPQDLHAVAVSEGPGSYTGLRIGVSAAKGLAFSLGIPLIATSTLETMAQHVRKLHLGFHHYLPMLDARRMEVYLAMYTQSGDCTLPVCAFVVDEAWASSLPANAVLFGDGSEKCKVLGNNFAVLDHVYPSAAMMAEEAERKFGLANFVDLAYFEPFYLKEFVPGISTKSIL
jgi:tRNA threonylcarbamoyladenosine biosynthesis protein TsaB